MTAARQFPRSGSPSRAPGSHVAGILHAGAARRRWLSRQRLENVHHQGGLPSSAAVKDDGRGRPQAASLVSSGRWKGLRGSGEAGEDGLARVRHGVSLHGCRRPGGEPARGGERRLYLIMANFQWERLIMALGSWAACAVPRPDPRPRSRSGRRSGARSELPGHSAQDRGDGDEDRGRPGDDVQRAAALHGGEDVREATLAKLFTRSVPRLRSPTRPSRFTAATAICASTTWTRRATPRADRRRHRRGDEGDRRSWVGL